MSNESDKLGKPGETTFNAIIGNQSIEKVDKGFVETIDMGTNNNTVPSIPAPSNVVPIATVPQEPSVPPMAEPTINPVTGKPIVANEPPVPSVPPVLVSTQPTVTVDPEMGTLLEDDVLYNVHFLGNELGLEFNKEDLGQFKEIYGTDPTAIGKWIKNVVEDTTEATLTKHKEVKKLFDILEGNGTVQQFVNAYGVDKQADISYSTLDITVAENQKLIVKAELIAKGVDADLVDLTLAGLIDQGKLVEKATNAKSYFKATEETKLQRIKQLQEENQAKESMRVKMIRDTIAVNATISGVPLTNKLRENLADFMFNPTERGESGQVITKFAKNWQEISNNPKMEVSLALYVMFNDNLGKLVEHIQNNSTLIDNTKVGMRKMVGGTSTVNNTNTPKPATKYEYDKLGNFKFSDIINPKN